MFLLSWHGTVVTQPNQTGALRHEALAGGDLTKALFLDVTDAAQQTSLRHAEIGTLRIRPAPEHGAICLLRDGFYLCADANTGLAVFDRLQPAGWESFLLLNETDAVGLDFILRHRWIVQATRQVIRRSHIGLHEGFKLRLGPYEVDLATSLATLATRRRDGIPIAIRVYHEGAEVALMVAEPRNSALVHTELWPPRARRVGELLTFAVHRIVAGREPTPEAFARDVTFLRDRQGAAGLEDLLEQMIEAPLAEAQAVREEPNETMFQIGLAEVNAFLEAARPGPAKAALERLMTAFPDVAQLWFRLGELHHQDGAYARAEQAWERCLVLDPRHETAGLRLANLIAHFGRHMESIELLKALVAAAPRAHEPRVFLAQRYADLDWMDLVLETFAPIGRELADWKEAIRRRMVERFDDNGKKLDALSSLDTLQAHEAVQQARLIFSRGRLDECEKLLAGFSPDISNRADAHMLQADLRLRRDGLSEAIAYLEAVHGPARAHPMVIIGLARLQISAARPQQAMAALEALVRHTPRTDALRLLCMLAHSANDRELLRFAARTWFALPEPDTIAAQWSLLEAWSNGRVIRIDDAAAASCEPPFPHLVQFWDKAEQPAEIVQAVQTWQNRHPGMIHSVFDHAGARAFIAAHCTSEVLECYEAAYHPAMQSDIFRLAFLHVRGGVYVDADDFCVRDMRGIFAALSVVELIAVRSGEAAPYVFNGFIAARPGCTIIADALQEAVRNVLEKTRNGRRLDIWQITGPGLLTRAIARFMVDEANAGKVMLLNDAEYHRFSITQDMAYKREEKGDWRLVAPVAPKSGQKLFPVARDQADTDAMMIGWAMRNTAPWHFRPLERSETYANFERLNNTLGSISLYRFAEGKVTLMPKPDTSILPRKASARPTTYLRFFQSVVPFLPPGFSTTVCMGTDDEVPGVFDVPVFGFQKKVGSNTPLLPDIGFLIYDFYATPQYQDRLAYGDKQNKVVFTGSTKGGLITPEVAREASTPRLRAAKFFAGSGKVDFRLPSIIQCSSPEAEAILREQPFCQKPTLEWHEQFRNRMLLSMDGNGAACSRVAVALHSNSVLLKYNSNHVLYYFDTLQPWVHYVPIAEDGDVEQVVDLDGRETDLFAQIASNGRRFAQSFLSTDALRRYTAILLGRYEACFFGSRDSGAGHVNQHRQRLATQL